jgi:FixJ family two-component response regulator
LTSHESPGVVFVVDDDDSVRRALSRRLRVAGFAVEAFASAQEFLGGAALDATACVVTDVRMPGMSGLDLQSSLIAAGFDMPIVFITGHGDVPTSVQAMRAGAVHFLPKPFTDAQILSAVREALSLAVRRATERSVVSGVRARHATLTAREREVFTLVVDGLQNKLIADRLGAAEKTIKIHRGRVMAKMGAKSVADLVRIAARLKISPGADSTM